MKLVKIALTPPIAAISVAFFAALSSFGATRYVDYVNGSNGGDATSAPGWKTLAYAVSSADPNDEIVLARGTHVVAADITVNKPLTIRGEGEMGETRISATGKYYIDIAADGVLFHSVMFYKYGHNYLSGATRLNGNSTMSNIVFTACGTPNNDNKFLVQVAKGLLTCCVFTNNVCAYNAGIEAKGSSIIENCVFINNETKTGTTAGQIIAIPAGDDNHTIIRNCTIANNKLKGASGAIYSYTWSGASNSRVYNNIIWNNRNSQTDAIQNWSMGNYSDGCKRGWKNNCTTPLDNLPAGNGNFSEDPKILVDGLHIAADSSCRANALTGVDASGASYTAAFDLSGRVRGDTPSVGAFEYVEIELPLTVVAEPPLVNKVFLPDTIPFTCMVGGSYEEPLTYAWRFDQAGEVTADTASVDLDVPGTYVNPTITVTDKNGKTASTVVEGTYTVVLLVDETYYVDYQNGDDGNDGAEGSPWKTLAFAVGQAAPGNTIILRKGVHSVEGDINFDKRITVLGEGENWETTLDCGGAKRALTLSGEGVVLGGVTITRLGNLNNAARMVTLQNGSMITNVVFNDCQAQQFLVGFNDGKMSCCWVTNCVGDQGIGAVCDGLGNKGVIDNCVFAWNDTTGTSGNGCVLVFNQQGEITMRNCTIAHNQLKGTKPAVYAYYLPKGYFSNNIIFDNVNKDSGETQNWKYGQGNWYANATTPLIGNATDGNVENEPVFRGDGLHLASTSPLKTAGRTALGDGRVLATAVDLDGVPRGDPPAIGAFEYVQTAELDLKPSASATFVRQPDIIQLSVQVEGGVGELLYAWDFDGDGQVDSTEAEPTLEESGFYTPSVTVTDTETMASKTAQLDVECYVHPAEVLVRCVDAENGDDEGGDGTAAKPLKSIEAALADKRMSEGDEIRLVAGTYPVIANLLVEKSVAIVGAGEGVTVLDGQGGNAKITLSAPGAALRDLTMANFGDGSKSNPLVLEKGSLVSNMTFTACSVYEGLVSIVRGTMQDCYVTNNTGVLAVGVSCVDSGNQAVIENCAFVGNAVTGSTLSGAIAIFRQQSTVTMRNCTIAHNQLKNKKPALYCYWTNVEVDNTIVRFNVDQDDGKEYNWNASGGTSTATWNCNCTSPVTGLDGSGNFEDDPLFKKDNLHLQKTSPCIGAADSTSATAYDLDGVERGDTPAVGAFEFVKTSTLELLPSASATFVRLPATITLSCAVEGAVGDVSYAWDFDGDGNVDSTESAPEIAVAGFYTPSVTVTDEKGQVETEAVPEELYVHVAEKLVRYLDDAGSDETGDGSYDNPYVTLSAALAEKSIAAGDEIVYKRGTHVLGSEVSVTKAVTVRGEGLAGETVLDGRGGVGASSTGIVLPIDGAAVQSLTVSNTCWQFSVAGAISMTSDSVVSNVVVTGMFADCEDSDNSNGRQMIFASKGLLTGCWITNNLPFGILVRLEGSVVLENCYIAGNTCRGASYSDAIVSLASANAIVRNCTVVDNRVRKDSALNICDAAKIYNNILWGNVNYLTGEKSNWMLGDDVVTMTGWHNNCADPRVGRASDGNIQSDPLLTAGSPEIPVASPCRNMGNDALGAVRGDIFGNPRRAGRHVDIGCVECQSGYGLIIRVR